MVLATASGADDGHAAHAPRKQVFRVAPYTARMAMLTGSMDWGHRDPFDRMIAATALEMVVPVVSTDEAFDDLDGWPEWRGRVWAGRSAKAGAP